jgi:Rrf2 family protein
MQITRASDYAVRVMIHMAGLPARSTVRQSELSRVTGVSGHFLSKVLQQLVRARLVRSQRGSGGGYVLAVAACNVSLLDVVQAVEGPVRLNQCIDEGPSCERKSWCPAHCVWAEAQAAIVNVLGGASMAHLAAQGQMRSLPGYQLVDAPSVSIKDGSDKGREKSPARTRTQRA